MKNTTTKMMIAAAALALVTGAAWAQALTADIPFAFQIAGKALPAGGYYLETRSNGQLFLRNLATREGAMLLSNGSTGIPKEWQAKGEPMMAFECGAGRCTLAQLWNGSANAAYLFPRPKLGGTETASLTLIRLVRGNGD